VAHDRRLAKHLVSLYYEDPPKRASPVKASDLAEYISFAKQNCHPQISDAAAHALVEGYVEMRQAGAIGGGRKTITATPRQLESLVRLSEALARIQLQGVVQVSHVAEAVRLMNVATQRAAMDPRTGTIDMDAINTGVGALERAATRQLAEAVLDRIKTDFSAGGVSVQQLVRVIGAQSSVPVEAKEVMSAIDLLVEDDEVEFIARTGVVRLL
jgi:DNA replication licensing factor MCM4